MTEQIDVLDDRAATRVRPPPLRPLAPPPSLLSALRQFPMLVLLPLVLLAAAGVTYAVKRPPVYTAMSELNVGVPNSDSQATPGYALAAQELAASYSREATSQVVTGPASRALRLSAATTAARLSSSAVPNSPTFYINATGPNATAAMALANRATAVLRSKVNAGLQSQSAGQLLVRYTALQAEANRLTTLGAKLQGRRTGGLASAAATSTVPNPTTYTTASGSVVKIPSAAQVAAAKLQAQTAQLKAQTVAGRYTTAESAGPAANLVVLFAAHTASDDRATVTERYGLVGALAGIVIGAALAFLLARWRARRVSPYV